MPLYFCFGVTLSRLKVYSWICTQGSYMVLGIGTLPSIQSLYPLKELFSTSFFYLADTSKHLIYSSDAYISVSNQSFTSVS